MAKLMVLYGKPTDTEEFNTHYFQIHVPLAKKIPGLRRYEVSSGPVAAPQGTSQYHMVAQLEFDSQSADAGAFDTQCSRRTQRERRLCKQQPPQFAELRGVGRRVPALQHDD